MVCLHAKHMCCVHHGACPMMTSTRSDIIMVQCCMKCCSLSGELCGLGVPHVMGMHSPRGQLGGGQGILLGGLLEDK